MTEFEILSLKYMLWQNVISIAGFAITILSIVAVYLDYRYRKSKEKAEKAIEIAKYFMDEILPGLAMINYYCEEANIDDLLNKYKFYEYEDFDESELNLRFSESEIEKIIDVFKSTEIPNNLKAEETMNEKRTIKMSAFSAILLNKLEYMCMFIASGVADGDYIYSSLHQVFLSSIQTLYVRISKLNVNEKDKYYTNIIDVYNQWKIKYLKEAKREEKISQKLEQKIKRIKRKFKKKKKIS